MPYLDEPDLGLAINSELEEPELTQEASIERLPGNYAVEYINASSNPAKSNRFLITLIDVKTGDERLIDLLTDDSSFKSIATEIRKHFDYGFEIFEIIAPNEPF